MVVRATRKGLYGDILRPAGEEFSVDPELFSSAWMEPVDGEAKKVSAGRAEASRKRAIASIEAEIAVLEKKLRRLGKPGKRTVAEVEVL